MSNDWRDKKPNCYLEFRVYDQDRFAVLQRFFKSLREWTQNQSIPTDTGEPEATVANRTSVSAGAADETQESARALSSDETQQRRNFARPEEWLLAFKPDDLDYLGMPDHADAIRALRDWQGMSRRERRKLTRGNRELQTLADFADMIRYWQDVEYELVSCEMEESDRARIEYSTFDFPFKGKVALEELLLFFGFFSIMNDSC